MPKDRAKDPRRVADVGDNIGGDYFHDKRAQEYFNAMGFNKDLNKGPSLAERLERSQKATAYHYQGKTELAGKGHVAAAREKTRQRIENRESAEGYEGIKFGSKRGEK